jgi:glutaredoxin
LNFNLKGEEDGNEKNFGYCCFTVFDDVKAFPERMEEMLRLSHGKRKVPVIVANGEVTVGCGGA